MLGLFWVYAGLVGLLGLYSGSQWYLLWAYLREKRRRKGAELSLEGREWPMVTVQLPVYNERFVVADLLQAVGRLDYPDARWEVQILDDSTDETSEIIAEIVAEIAAARPNLQLWHRRRQERRGFKAGALAEAMETAKGEYLAIFDADFEPPQDFLRRVLPLLEADKNLGLVQTRWAHKNETATLLTRLQALALDAHFSIEQGGRSASQLFMNFNGTAGIWRRQAIIDGGGWSSDTLTEDLDLSYRAQLAGWQMRYLEEVSSPAELPEAVSAIKSQQYRWNKGAAEVARKVLRQVWQAKLPLWKKWQATIHLLNSSTFVLIFLSSVLSVPLNLYGQPWQRQMAETLGLALGLGLLGFVSVGYFSRRRWSPRQTVVFLWRLPLFIAGMYGLSFFNAVAVIEGWHGRKTPFIRTPKTGKIGNYPPAKLSLWWWLEVLLLLYFLTAAILGAAIGKIMPLHFLIAAGYALVTMTELKQQKQI